jgi:hypothetical protein
MTNVLQDLLRFMSALVFSSCLYPSAAVMSVSRSVARIRCNRKPAAASDLQWSEQSALVNTVLKFLYFVSVRIKKVI